MKNSKTRSTEPQSEEGASIHVFDLDHTLLRVNSSFHFSRYLYRRGVLKLSEMLRIYWGSLRYQLGLLSLNQIHDEAFKALFCGNTLHSWSCHLPEYLDKHLMQLTSPSVAAILEKARSRGAVTALFSSSPAFIVEAIAKRFSIEHVTASKYEVDKVGRFVKIASLLDGEGKKSALRRLAGKCGIPLERTVAYSDSIIDLPLLESAGRAVCVEPDRRLREYARKQGWEVLAHGSSTQSCSGGGKAASEISGYSQAGS